MKNFKVGSFLLSTVLLSSAARATVVIVQDPRNTNASKTAVDFSDPYDKNQQRLTNEMVKTLVAKAEGRGEILVPYHQMILEGAFDVAEKPEEPTSPFPIRRVVINAQGEKIKVNKAAFPRDIEEIDFLNSEELSIDEKTFEVCKSSMENFTYRYPKIKCIKINKCILGKGRIYLSTSNPVRIRFQNVETLPEGFLACNKLYDLELTSVEKIGPECFMGSVFKDMGPVMSLIERLEEIPEYAFDATKDLKGNKMAVSLQKCRCIGSKAFMLCQCLDELKSETAALGEIGSLAFLRSSVRSIIVETSADQLIIKDQAFCCCPALQSVRLIGTIQAAESLFQDTGTEKRCVFELSYVPEEQLRRIFIDAGDKCVVYVHLQE